MTVLEMALLIQCIESGQVSAAQIEAHKQDEAFAAVYAAYLEGKRARSQ